MKSICFAIAYCGTLMLGISAASACDMSQSMTDPTCANMGFPNVFNNPPPAPPPAPAPMVQGPMQTYLNGPVYADGILGLFEDHPKMIYPQRPIVCRRGIDCPGDATDASAAMGRPSKRKHHRVTQAAE